MLLFKVRKIAILAMIVYFIDQRYNHTDYETYHSILFIYIFIIRIDQETSTGDHYSPPVENIGIIAISILLL
jgi:hypothetical protein